VVQVLHFHWEAPFELHCPPAVSIQAHPSHWRRRPHQLLTALRSDHSKHANSPSPYPAVQSVPGLGVSTAVIDLHITLACSLVILPITLHAWSPAVINPACCHLAAQGTGQDGDFRVSQPDGPRCTGAPAGALDGPYNVASQTHCFASWLFKESPWPALPPSVGTALPCHPSPVSLGTSLLRHLSNGATLCSRATSNSTMPTGTASPQQCPGRPPLHFLSQSMELFAARHGSDEESLPGEPCLAPSTTGSPQNSSNHKARDQRATAQQPHGQTGHACKDDPCVRQHASKKCGLCTSASSSGEAWLLDHGLVTRAEVAAAMSPASWVPNSAAPFLPQPCLAPAAVERTPRVVPESMAQRVADGWAEVVSTEGMGMPSSRCTPYVHLACRVGQHAELCCGTFLQCAMPRALGHRQFTVLDYYLCPLPPALYTVTSNGAPLPGSSLFTIAVLYRARTNAAAPGQPLRTVPTQPQGSTRRSADLVPVAHSADGSKHDAHLSVAHCASVRQGSPVPSAEKTATGRGCHACRLSHRLVRSSAWKPFPGACVSYSPAHSTSGDAVKQNGPGARPHTAPEKGLAEGAKASSRCMKRRVVTQCLSFVAMLTPCPTSTGKSSSAPLDAAGTGASNRRIDDCGSCLEGTHQRLARQLGQHGGASQGCMATTKFYQGPDALDAWPTCAGDASGTCVDCVMAGGATLIAFQHTTAQVMVTLQLLRQRRHESTCAEHEFSLPTRHGAAGHAASISHVSMASGPALAPATSVSVSTSLPSASAAAERLPPATGPQRLCALQEGCIRYVKGTAKQHALHDAEGLAAPTAEAAPHVRYDSCPFTTGVVGKRARCHLTEATKDSAPQPACCCGNDDSAAVQQSQRGISNSSVRPRDPVFAHQRGRGANEAHAVVGANMAAGTHDCLPCVGVASARGASGHVGSGQEAGNSWPAGRHQCPPDCPGCATAASTCMQPQSVAFGREIAEACGQVALWAGRSVQRMLYAPCPQVHTVSNANVVSGSDSLVRLENPVLPLALVKGAQESPELLSREAVIWTA
jgi:hypothetical protein